MSHLERKKVVNMSHFVVNMSHLEVFENAVCLIAKGIQTIQKKIDKSLISYDFIISHEFFEKIGNFSIGALPQTPGFF